MRDLIIIIIYAIIMRRDLILLHRKLTQTYCYIKKIKTIRSYIEIKNSTGKVNCFK